MNTVTFYYATKTKREQKIIDLFSDSAFCVKYQIYVKFFNVNSKNNLQDSYSYAPLLCINDIMYYGNEIPSKKTIIKMFKNNKIR